MLDIDFQPMSNVFGFFTSCYGITISLGLEKCWTKVNIKAIEASLNNKNYQIDRYINEILHKISIKETS